MPHFIVGPVGTILPRSLGSSGPMRPHERGVSVQRDDAWAGLPVPVLGGHIVCFRISPPDPYPEGYVTHVVTRWGNVRGVVALNRSGPEEW